MSEKPESSGQFYRITRVYTRTGDSGLTRLATGLQVPKNHPRLNAYGTVDELQVAIGAARDAMAAVTAGQSDTGLAALGSIGPHLVYFQHLLFTLSGDLATPVEDRRPQMPLLSAVDVQYLENLIDFFNKDLPPLTDFLLPGGHPVATALHVCRVVCRRAEREVETLASGVAIGDWVRPVLNRMSDAFFVLARYVMHELKRAGIAQDEQVWRKNLSPPPL